MRRKDREVTDFFEIRLTKRALCDKMIILHAGMLELADEADSKSAASNSVWVRPPLPAPGSGVIVINYDTARELF